MIMAMTKMGADAMRAQERERMGKGMLGPLPQLSAQANACSALAVRSADRPKWD